MRMDANGRTNVRPGGGARVDGDDNAVLELEGERGCAVGHVNLHVAGRRWVGELAQKLDGLSPSAQLSANQPLQEKPHHHHPTTRDAHVVHAGQRKLRVFLGGQDLVAWRRDAGHQRPGREAGARPSGIAVHGEKNNGRVRANLERQSIRYSSAGQQNGCLPYILPFCTDLTP